MAEPEKYSFGESYIYGKISSFEKNCLDKKYRLQSSNNICYLDSDVYVVEGEFLCCDDDKYCRSDCYKHTPKNFKIIKIGEIENEKNINYGRSNK